MKHKANIDFFEFREKVLPTMSGSSCQVRRIIGSAVRSIPRFPKGRAIIQDSEWRDWLHEVELPIDQPHEYGWLGKNGKERDMSNFVSKLQSPGSGSRELAAALYYRLHYHVEDLRYAQRVDDIVFGEGISFADENFDVPVFKISFKKAVRAKNDVLNFLDKRRESNVWLKILPAELSGFGVPNLDVPSVQIGNAHRFLVEVPFAGYIELLNVSPKFQGDGQQIINRLTQKLGKVGRKIHGKRILPPRRMQAVSVGGTDSVSKLVAICTIRQLRSLTNLDEQEAGNDYELKAKSLGPLCEEIEAIDGQQISICIVDYKVEKR